jgi:hypothetical protein
VAASGSLSDGAAMLACCCAVGALVWPASGVAGSVCLSCASVAVASPVAATGCVSVRLPSWSDERGSGTGLGVVPSGFGVVAAGAFAAAASLPVMV